ncbi:SRPBCC family protein [Natronomonas sp. LN261]|jgi:ligand-binding SRPBCC domain-containing protein|uniref:SRPBCC family protein n=1 Tax=Natronomonas sp. LN261 TaxID=2750669 RepID=UPI0015EE8EE7|nr:SRPBCC family protein [Natronomonas sp. LN261]
MTTYRRETYIDAPFEDVWGFHSTTDGLEALTPGFMNLEVESVTGPDGEADPAELGAGSRIELSMRPLGIGPRQRMVSVITDRERDGGTGMFRDVMESGPFAEWEHTHRFFADGDGTIVSDRVEYRLPGGPLGRAVSPLGRVGLVPMFFGRHRTTKKLLEE